MERQSLPKLNHEETENMNRLITSKESQSAIKILPIKKSPRPDGFVNSTKHLRRTNTYLLKLFQKTLEEVFPIHYQISINMIPKLDKDTTRK